MEIFQFREAVLPSIGDVFKFINTRSKKYGFKTAVNQAVKNIMAIWQKNGAYTISKVGIVKRCHKLLENRTRFLKEYNSNHKPVNGYVPSSQSLSMSISRHRRPDVGRELSRRSSPSVYRRSANSNSDPAVSDLNVSGETSQNESLPCTPVNPPDPPPPHKKREPPGDTIAHQQWLSEFGNNLFDIATSTRQTAGIKRPNDEPVSIISVTEIPEEIFQTEIQSDMEKIIPVIMESLAAMQCLSYEWEVQPLGMTVVVKPKEEDIDATKLFQQGKGNLEFQSLSPSKRMKMSPDSTMTSGVTEEDEGISYLPNHGDDPAATFASPDYDQLEQKVNFDTLIILEEKPLQTSGDSIWKDQSKTAMSESGDSGVFKPLLPKNRISKGKKNASLREARTALDIINKHPDDFVLHLRQKFGKASCSKHRQKHSLKSHPPQKCCNPGWNVRILAALALNGPMDANKIFGWVSNVFNHNRHQSRNKYENFRFRDHMSILLGSKIVVVATTPKEQVFRLAGFLLFDNMSKSESIASKIANEYCHNAFLNAADQVEEVINEFEDKKIYKVDAMHVWNKQFPNPSMVQMVTASILFQGTSEKEFVSISDVENFIEGSFLEWKMDERTKNELLTSLNCMNSMGIIQVDLATQTCKLCNDFDVIRVLVSNMSMTELFDLLPPPLSLSYKDLLIISFYILDPQRKSLHFQTAKKFLLQRFFSSSSNANSDRTTFSQKVAKPALRAAVLEGVLKQSRGTYCYILSDSMYEALDAHFKDEQRVWPIMASDLEDGKGMSVEIAGGAPSKEELTIELENDHEAAEERDIKDDTDKAACIAELKEPTQKMPVSNLAGEDTIIEAIDAVLIGIAKQTEEDTMAQAIGSPQMLLSELPQDGTRIQTVNDLLNIKPPMPLCSALVLHEHSPVPQSAIDLQLSPNTINSPVSTSSISQL